MTLKGVVLFVLVGFPFLVPGVFVVDYALATVLDPYSFDNKAVHLGEAYNDKGVQQSRKRFSLQVLADAKGEFPRVLPSKHFGEIANSLFDNVGGVDVSSRKLFGYGLRGVLLISSQGCS